MPEVAFVISGRQDYALRALAETLSYELELQAVPCSLHIGSFPAPRPQLVTVLLDPLTYSRLEGEHALPDKALLRRTIFLCAEPPPSAADEEQLELLGLGGAVFCVDQRSVVTLHRAGIPARLLKPGYSESLDHFDAESPRPIDVLFLGSQTPRVSRALTQVRNVVAHRTCQIEVPAAEPTAEEIDSPLAEGRWPLLTQAKILINLHRDEGSRFEWRHGLDAVHAGAVVVTEHSSGLSPLVPGEHLFAAHHRSVPYVVEALLDDEERIARVRSRGYERLRTWLPYGLSVAVLRAAIVELVGEPIPVEAAVNRAA